MGDTPMGVDLAAFVMSSQEVLRRSVNALARRNVTQRMKDGRKREV